MRSAPAKISSGVGALRKRDKPYPLLFLQITMNLIRLSLLLPVMLAVSFLSASENPEAWLQLDDDTSTRLVNEGDLEFLHETPDRRVLHTHNRLSITPGSLHNGWVQLYQCQSNLDPVSAVEVVYRYHGLRKLRVISTRGIQRAQVENNSVQMEQVGEGAEICIEAEVQVLNKTGAGQYQLTSGPFHRRFLDGYYPLRLDYRIHWPAGMLQLESVLPEIQEGFSVSEQAGELFIDTLFEGMLTIEVRFNTL